MFGSLLASILCGFGEDRQLWLVQLKPDPLGDNVTIEQLGSIGELLSDSGALRPPAALHAELPRSDFRSRPMLSLEGRQRGGRIAR